VGELLHVQASSENTFRTEEHTTLASTIGYESVQWCTFCFHWLCPWGDF